MNESKYTVAKKGVRLAMVTNINHLRVLLAAAAVGVLAALGVLVLAVEDPAEAAFPDDAGKIVYSGADAPNGDHEIYTINAVGGGRSAITDNSWNDFHPSYSPSGDRIIYSSQDGPGGDYEIYTINPLGGNRVKVTDNTTDDFDPSYSPSAEGKIVYSSQDPSGGDYEIYTINLLGGNKYNVTDNATDDFDPSYGYTGGQAGPSGYRIVYSGRDGPTGDFEIYTINPLGGNKVKATNNITNDRDPSYAPGGKAAKIVYEGYDRHGHDYEIYTILDPAFGKSKGVKVTNNATDDSDPSYSPDSTQITYSGEHTPTGSPTGDYEIYTINTLGNNKYQVTDNTTNDYSPSWGSSVVVGMKPPPPAQLSQP